MHYHKTLVRLQLHENASAHIGMQLRNAAALAGRGLRACFGFMLIFISFYNAMVSSLTRKFRDDFLLTLVKEGGDYSIKTINIKLLVFGSVLD